MVWLQVVCKDTRCAGDEKSIRRVLVEEFVMVVAEGLGMIGVELMKYVQPRYFAVWAPMHLQQIDGVSRVLVHLSTL